MLSETPEGDSSVLAITRSCAAVILAEENSLPLKVSNTALLEIVMASNSIARLSGEVEPYKVIAGFLERHKDDMSPFTVLSFISSLSKAHEVVADAKNSRAFADIFAHVVNRNEEDALALLFFVQTLYAEYDGELWTETEWWNYVTDGPCAFNLPASLVFSCYEAEPHTNAESLRKRSMRQFRAKWLELDE